MTLAVCFWFILISALQWSRWQWQFNNCLGWPGFNSLEWWPRGQQEQGQNNRYSKGTTFDEPSTVNIIVEMNYRHFGDKRFQYPRRTFYNDRREAILSAGSSPYYYNNPPRYHFWEEREHTPVNDIDYDYYYFNERRVPYFKRHRINRYLTRENQLWRRPYSNLLLPRETENYYRGTVDPYWNEEFYDNNFYYGWD